MNSEVIIEVLDRLIGSVQPYGSTQIDAERMENLEVLLEVTDECIKKIADVAKFINRHEYSIKKMADRSYEYLAELAGYLVYQSGVANGVVGHEQSNISN